MLTDRPPASAVDSCWAAAVRKFNPAFPSHDIGPWVALFPSPAFLNAIALPHASSQSANHHQEPEPFDHSREQAEHIQSQFKAVSRARKRFPTSRRTYIFVFVEMAFFGLLCTYLHSAVRRCDKQESCDCVLFFFLFLCFSLFGADCLVRNVAQARRCCLYRALWDWKFPFHFYAA